MSFLKKSEPKKADPPVDSPFEKPMDAPGLGLPVQTAKLEPGDTARVRISAPVDPSLARALACAPCSQRDAVISNIEAGAYGKCPENLETDLKWLEAMPH